MNYPKHPDFKDLSGERFNKLVVLKFSSIRKNGKSGWVCQCDCGKMTWANTGDLRKGRKKSCGCLVGEYQKNRASLLIKDNKVEYSAYNHARFRCNSEKYKQYKDYGGRGIKFLFKSFKEFLDEIGPRPSEYHQLDRIDNDGNYETGNIRWATRSDNCRNRKRK